VIPLGLIGVGYGYLDDDNWRLELIRLAMPLLRLLDPETAHSVVISLAKYGLVPHERRDPLKALHEEVLRTKVWNKSFDNPVGLAAGFDKNAEAMESMLGVGFGFVEVGSITPEPQDGNARPRIFRIPEERAVINRIGCNSHGSKVVSDRIKCFRDKSKEGERGGVLGINIAKNKTSKDGAKDYVEACKRLADKADYIVINVSSPNTPGLRKLQAGKELSKILVHMKKTLDTFAPGVPLVVKVAPDLTLADKKQIAKVCLRHRVDGLIVSNTTISRPESVLSRASGNETGGLSGKPLCKISTELIKEMYELTGGKIPIIGCGGVSTGSDVYDKIKAGASLVQLYTALVYEGPALIPKLKRELSECLLRDGYASVEDACGADTKVKQTPWYYFWRTSKRTNTNRRKVAQKPPPSNTATRVASARAAPAQ
jgi:dihydroorotate dehydrogenase